jgi:ubiquinone/menaquinone biosynthesis C-methylase UbiE
MPDHHGADGATHDGTADAELAELLDLDGEVLRSYWTDVLTWVRHAATGTARERILDLGAGSGVGAIALAQRFGGAEVIAVDASEEMLRRIRVKALDLGLAHRIRTVQADLNVVWPAIDPIDVTWASMSLHHLADPDRVLGEVFASTRPGGLVAVAEMAEPLRFLPHDVGFGRPGLETRCLDALGKEHAYSLPELGSDWSARLERAGFTVFIERTFPIELNAPHPRATAHYARQWLCRLRSGLAHRLAHDDLAALGALIEGVGPESLLHRDDLQIRGSRTVTLARHP